jgi:hypothetical protein
VKFLVVALQTHATMIEYHHNSRYGLEMWLKKRNICLKAKANELGTATKTKK